MLEEKYIFEEEDNYKEDEKNTILDEIDSLTHVYIEQEDGTSEIKPWYCMLNVITDNFGMSDKEAIDLALENGYKILKLSEVGSFEGGLAVADAELSLDEVKDNLRRSVEDEFDDVPDFEVKEISRGEKPEKKEESLKEEWQEPADEHLDELDKLIDAGGFKIVYANRRNLGSIPYIHYQIISKEGNQTKETFEKAIEWIEETLDKFEDDYGYPTTFNIGLQEDGFISCGFDVEGAYYKPGDDVVWRKPTKLTFRDGKPADDATKAQIQDIANHMGMSDDDVTSMIPADRPKKEAYSRKTVELYYPELEITVWHKVSDAVLYPVDYSHPAEYDDEQIEIEYTYEIDEEDAIYSLFEILSAESEFDDYEEEELDKYIREHLDELLDKYNDELLDEYRDSAREEAEANYEEPDYEPEYEPDYDDMDEGIDAKHGDVENAPFVVSCDGERFAFDTKHNMEAFIERNKHSFNKIEIVRCLDESLEKDYSNIELIDRFDFENKRAGGLPGINNIKGFINALNKVGKDIFKCRTTTFGKNLSDNDLKDAWLDIQRNGWSVGRAWDSSLSGFNEIYICKKIDGSIKEEVEKDALDVLKDKLDFHGEKDILTVAEKGQLDNPDASKIETEISEKEFDILAKELHDEDNLEEDIEKHDTLNPELFEGNEMKADVKEALQNIVDTFVDELAEDGIKMSVKDILLIGSNASYNYTKDSDIDLHIIVDSDALECPAELQDKLYGAYRSIFNKNYEITIKGIPCEIYVELDEPRGKSNGVYSLNTGWVKEPVQQDIPELDKEAFDKLFNEWEDKYTELLNKEDLTSDEVAKFIEDIYDLRQKGISGQGEYSLENLTFKELRNLGQLDDLKDLRKELKGKELSLESMNEEMNANNASELFKLIDAELGVLNVILSSDTEDREVLDKEEYEKAKEALSDGIEATGMWRGAEQPHSHIIKCDLTRAKKLAKDLCQKEFITILFEDENKFISKLFSTDLDDYSNYDEIESSGKVVYGEDASKLDGYTVVGDTAFSLGLYGSEELDAFQSLTEEEKSTIMKEDSEEKHNMHKLTLKNPVTRTWFEYYKDIHGWSDEEIEDSYGTKEELSGEANYYADLYDGDDKIAELNFANFDGMPDWAELGVAFIASRELRKALSKVGYDEDDGDGLENAEFVLYVDNAVYDSTPEEVLAKYVKDIEDAMNETPAKTAEEEFEEKYTNRKATFTHLDEYEEEESDLESREGDECVILHATILDGFDKEQSDDESFEYCYWTIEFEDGKVFDGIPGVALDVSDEVVECKELKEDFNEMKQLSYDFYDYLQKQGVYYEIFPEENGICVDISWGDWKHDHLWLDYVADSFFKEKGYEIVNNDVEVTEEDGSDTYSATHTFTLRKI